MIIEEDLAIDSTTKVGELPVPLGSGFGLLLEETANLMPGRDLLQAPEPAHLS